MDRIGSEHDDRFFNLYLQTQLGEDFVRPQGEFRYQYLPRAQVRIVAENVLYQRSSFQ